MPLGDLMKRKHFVVLVAAAQFVSLVSSIPPTQALRLEHRSPLVGQIARDSDSVAFNTSNYKYHSLSCIWAERCTVHCITISRKEAHKRGGVPCKVCGGGE